MNPVEEIKKIFRGEVFNDSETLEQYSRDASLFKVTPKVVVYPQDKEDIKNLVKWAEANSGFSITMRAAGSDMTGGSIGESIVVDVSKHLNKVGEIDQIGTWVEPGVFYRDFEKKTWEKGLTLPCYPASKSLCALGGMYGNNCGGEKTLRYGKMEDFVLESKVILSDGNEYEVKPLSKMELESKMAQGDFEGNLYKDLFNLLEENGELIKESEPRVSKNSAGYYLWNVYPEPVEGSARIFDLNKLLVGSQGTLGLVTEMKVKLEKDKKHHDMVALFFKSWEELPEVVNAVLKFGPESLETFDEDTLKLGLRFMPEVAKKAGTSLLKFAFKFIPEALIGARMHGLPKLIVLVEVSEDTEEEVKTKVKNIVEAIKPFKIWHRVIEKDSEEEKFWVMRRESFKLLKDHGGHKKAAPFIEDFCIQPEKIPEFLPKALKILKNFGIKANIAGHAGNGNFHIIPLMDLKKQGERDKIVAVSLKFYNLIREYRGSITAEHNDGIIRTPFLDKMYSNEMLGLFKQTKDIFDPKNIFNPGKKVPSTGSGQVGSIEYLEKHIAIE